MKKPELTFVYHHTGIPTKTPQKNERYLKKIKMYVTNGHNEHRIVASL